MKRLRIYAAIVLAVLLVAACGSLPAKQRAVLGNQAAGQAIWALQDAERRICNPAVFDKDPTIPITECTGPTASAAGLTTAKHQEFAKTLSTAYGLRIRLDNLLLQWQPGAPEPSELKGLQDQANGILTIARSLAMTERQKELVALAELLMAEVQKIAATIRGAR